MNQLVDQFFNNEPIVIEGYLVKSSAKKAEPFVTVQAYPGVIMDIDKKHVKELEEATDPITGKTYVKLTITPDAEIKTVFQLRLARLAMSRDEGGIPYSFREDLNLGDRGNTVYVDPPMVSTLARAPGQQGPGGGTYGTPSIGEFNTRCNRHFYGWVNDDKRYIDNIQDRSGPVII